MFPSVSTLRSVFGRPGLIINPLKASKYMTTRGLTDRARRELLNKYQETNAEVFNQLKETYFKSSSSPVIDWTELRTDLIKEYPRVYNKFNFEVQFMQHLLKLDNCDDHLVQSFIGHVERVLFETDNKVVLCHLIRFLLAKDKHPDIAYIRTSLNNICKDENFIKYPVVGKAWADFAKLSPETCREATDFALEHRVLQVDALVTLLNHTLENGLFEDTVKLLKVYRAKKVAQHIVQQWMNSLVEIKDHWKRLREIDRLVQTLQSQRYLFPRTMLNKVENFLQSCQLDFKISKIEPDSRTCSTCGCSMEAITEEELRELRAGVEANLINKFGEIYIVSTPQEVEDFNRFMDSHSSAPFDLVIDGLNVSYYNTSRTIEEDKKTQLLSIKNLGLNESLYETMELNNIFELFPKILVIGRKHMARWGSIQTLKSQHKDQVWVYLLDNKSDDDIFTINAAIRSSRTYIWTADFLRQYKSLLGDDYNDTFDKWKFCRQIRFAPSSKRRLEFPTKVDFICQFNQPGQYHIPVNMNTRLDSDERVTARWLCINNRLIQ